MNICIYYKVDIVLQGNPTNHQVVFDHELIDYLNFIMRQPELIGVSQKDVMELHDTMANVIVAMIEENHAKPKRAKLLMVCVRTPGRATWVHFGCDV